jgi:hypothetical protein
VNGDPIDDIVAVLVIVLFIGVAESFVIIVYVEEPNPWNMLLD